MQLGLHDLQGQVCPKAGPFTNRLTSLLEGFKPVRALRAPAWVALLPSVASIAFLKALGSRGCVSTRRLAP